MMLTKENIKDLKKRGYYGPYDLGSLLRFLEQPGVHVADYYDKKTDTIQRKELTDVSPKLWGSDGYYECGLMGFDEYGDEIDLEGLYGLSLSGDSWESAVVEAVCWYLENFKICETEENKPESVGEVQREFEAIRHLQRVK